MSKINTLNIIFSFIILIGCVLGIVAFVLHFTFKRNCSEKFKSINLDDVSPLDLYCSRNDDIRCLICPQANQTQPCQCSDIHSPSDCSKSFFCYWDESTKQCSAHPTNPCLYKGWPKNWNQDKHVIDKNCKLLNYVSSPGAYIPYKYTLLAQDKSGNPCCNGDDCKADLYGGTFFDISEFACLDAKRQNVIAESIDIDNDSTCVYKQENGSYSDYKTWLTSDVIIDCDKIKIEKDCNKTGSCKWNKLNEKIGICYYVESIPLKELCVFSSSKGPNPTCHLMCNNKEYGDNWCNYYSSNKYNCGSYR